MTLIRGFGVVALAGALGCGGSASDLPTAAPAVLGRYDLKTSNGQPPPYVQSRFITVSANGGRTISCDNDVTGVVTELQTGARYTTTLHRAQICDDGRPNATGVDLEFGRFTIRGDSLTLASDASASGTHVSLAVLHGETLSVYHQETTSLSGSRTFNESLLIFAKLP